MKTPSSVPESTYDPLFSQSEEGQLALDVAETPIEVIVRTAIAGVLEKDLDIHITEDMVTIRGARHVEALPADATEHYSECFWGSFSRAVILPCRVKAEEANAVLHNGILTIRIPKTSDAVRVKVHKPRV
jgi:HSP20 family protein